MPAGGSVLRGAGAGGFIVGGRVGADAVVAAGSPAVVKRPIDGSPAQFWVDANPSAYADLAVRHRRGITRLD